MSGSTACSYEILGVSDLANSEVKSNISVNNLLVIFPAKVNSFDILEKLEERNLLHIRDRIFDLLDDRDINNCSQVSKSWQSFIQTNRIMRKKKLRMEMGEIGGAGHFWGNDKNIDDGGVRNNMGEKDLKKVLRLLALGEKKINLKEREFRAFLNKQKRK
ncbi:unnamed protein product [Oikopleura dioica]|uniref:F-box domain-containing protein n=1 Tax=Oikopleura dioica TaxID=34765 RepID=E4XTG3_OIKDI|nr:unnamed protein product [Oikopleura dioica]